jgi:hypothetical protein
MKDKLSEMLAFKKDQTGTDKLDELVNELEVKEQLDRMD